MLLLFFLLGCTPRVSFFHQINNLVKLERYDEALKKVEQEKYGKNNILLYYLDKAILSHYGGHYQKSTKLFSIAERLADDYFTKSITKEASTFLISDNARPYYGQNYERALIHLFNSLNYFLLGKLEDALVEARKVDHLLGIFQNKYHQKNVYKEDPFIRYLMGMLYEEMGEINDAYISYFKSLKAYEENINNYYVKPPEELIWDLLRTSNKLGFVEEKIRIERKYPSYAKKYSKPEKGWGELVVIHYNGLMPHKIDEMIEVTFGEGWAYVGLFQLDGEASLKLNRARRIARSISSDEQFVVAFPKFVPTPYSIVHSEIVIDSKSIPLKLVENIKEIAIKDLQDHIGRIRRKAIARAAIKYALRKEITRKVEKKAGEGWGFITKTVLKTVSAVTEEADKRCWSTLPAEIRMARIRLPKGLYSFDIIFKNKYGKVVKTKRYEVKILSGKRSLVIVRTVE